MTEPTAFVRTDGELSAEIPLDPETETNETVGTDGEQQEEERTQDEIDSDNEQVASSWADDLSAEELVGVVAYLGQVDPLTIDDEDLRAAVVKARDARNEMTGV